MKAPISGRGRTSRWRVHHTALDPTEMAHLNITSSATASTNSSLSVQLRSENWAEECKQKTLPKALILMGEIGGNDFSTIKDAVQGDNFKSMVGKGCTYTPTY